MRVMLIKTVVEAGALKTSMRRNPDGSVRKIVPFIKGTVLEMSDSSGQKYVDNGLAVEVGEDVPLYDQEGDSNEAVQGSAEESQSTGAAEAAGEKRDSASGRAGGAGKASSRSAGNHKGVGRGGAGSAPAGKHGGKDGVRDSLDDVGVVKSPRKKGKANGG